jgi:BirA family biotin operon repressor/biotin-[acetyl-CoA-carboxylase] ligase
MPSAVVYVNSGTREAGVVQARIAAILTEAKEQGIGYVSGGIIARHLGISRAAVWKYIEGIRSGGGIIDAVPGKGYQLVNSEDLLLPGAINLETDVIGREYVYLPEIDSTNSEAKRRIRSGCSDGLVLAAENQTAGRGRMGRPWYSVAGKNLSFSVVLFPGGISLSQAPLLTPLSAVAVCRAVKKVSGLSIELKWPNDLLIAGGKAGGILLEAGGEMDRLRYAIIGIGINVNLSREDMPDSIADTAASLMLAAGKPVPRRRLLEEILIALDSYYARFCTGEAQSILAEYVDLCSTLGREIEFLWYGQRRSGRAVSIAPDGALIVITEAGERLTLRAGDVHCL